MRHEQIEKRVRAVVEGHPLPDFLIGFEVRFGEFDGDPAMWIAFRRIPGPGRMTPEITRRVKAMNELEDALLPELLEAFEDGSIYFRYENDPAQAPVAE